MKEDLFRMYKKIRNPNAYTTHIDEKIRKHGTL